MLPMHLPKTGIGGCHTWTHFKLETVSIAEPLQNRQQLQFRPNFFYLLTYLLILGAIVTMIPY